MFLHQGNFTPDKWSRGSAKEYMPGLASSTYYIARVLGGFGWFARQNFNPCFSRG
jgi:hypothetical protein